MFLIFILKTCIWAFLNAQETVKWNTSGNEGMQLFDSHNFTATPTKVAPQAVAHGHR